MIDLTLNNGVTLPTIGLGVFQSPPEETAAAVETALRLGYRHIDTAAAYGNELQVGEGLRRSGVDRDEVFVETKVWVTDYGYDQTLHAFEKATGKLRIDTLDLLILHQPIPHPLRDHHRRLQGARNPARRRESAGDRHQQLHAHHLERLLTATEVVPAVNQVELHPYFAQPDVQRADAAHGILTQAWSPIGGITFYPGPWGDERRSVMQDATIVDIAAAYGKTAAQVMLRWGIQQGRSVIPKSTNPKRIAENFDVFDFELTAEDLARIDALDTGVRGGPDPDSPATGSSPSRSPKRDFFNQGEPMTNDRPHDDGYGAAELRPVGRRR